jgi:hypothetical protein
MKKKEKSKLIVEYLFNNSKTIDKNKMREFLLEHAVDEKELREFEKIVEDFYSLPDEEPGESMKAKFIENLEEYKQSIMYKESHVNQLSRIFEEIWQPVLIKKLAYAVVLFVFGCLAGYWYTSEFRYKTQVNSMISEMQDMQKVMMLTLLEQPSPTDRLKAISISNQIIEKDDKIINALLNTLNNDQNVNVRLMAVEALYNFADNPKVRIGLIKSITKQESPIVQAALADVMVLLQEKGSVEELQKLLNRNNLDESVETKLKNSIKSLI